jgi:hypothetical protein
MAIAQAAALFAVEPAKLIDSVLETHDGQAEDARQAKADGMVHTS